MSGCAAGVPAPDASIASIASRTTSKNLSNDPRATPNLLGLLFLCRRIRIDLAGLRIDVLHRAARAEVLPNGLVLVKDGREQRAAARDVLGGVERMLPQDHRHGLKHEPLALLASVADLRKGGDLLRR